MMNKIVLFYFVQVLSITLTYGNKFLIGYGRGKDGNPDSSFEVIDLKNSSLSCRVKSSSYVTVNPQYWMQDGKPVTCGGMLPEDKKDCNHAPCFIKENEDWMLWDKGFSDPKLLRAEAVSVNVPNLGEWIIGGYYGGTNIPPRCDYLGEKSSILYTNDNKWVDGPLPDRFVARGCALQVSDARTFIYPGFGEYNLTYGYDWDAMEFFENSGDSHPDRSDVACGIDHYTGLVVIAGGYNDRTTENIKNSVLYDPNTNTWQSGPDLKNGLRGGRMVNVDGKLLFIGGMNSDGNTENTIYEFSLREWKLLDTGLMTPRSHFAIYQLDDDYQYQCLEN